MAQIVSFILNGNEFVLASSQAYLFAVFQSCLPVGIGVGEVEFVFPFEVFVRIFLAQGASVERRGFDSHVGTCLVESYRVEGGKYAEVGDYRRVVVIPAVTFGGDVHDEVDVEVRFAVDYGFGVFRYFAVKAFGGIAFSHHCTFVLAEGYALSAAYAFVVVDGCFTVASDVYGVVCAVFFAYPASGALVAVYEWLGRGVQFQFPTYACRAHAQVFQSASKAALFVSLEVVHADYDVGVGDGCSYFGGFAVFSFDGYFAVVSSFYSVGNDYVGFSR
jgi:hypothetical protein